MASEGFGVHLGQLQDHIGSVKSIAADAELADDAAKEISGFLDVGQFNLAYGMWSQAFGMKVHECYDEALPLFGEIVEATEFLRNRLAAAKEGYQRTDERAAQEIERVAEELDGITSPPVNRPSTPRANSSREGG